MSTFLQVMGVLFLLILGYIAFRILILVGKAVLIVYGFKKFVAQVGDQANARPTTIHLLRVFDAQWDDDQSEAAALAAPLPALGYEEVGFFDVDILGGTRLQAWVHPESGLYSVVYQSPIAGTWADVVAKYEDGTSLTYSNSPKGGRLRQRPGRENVYFPGLGTGELHAKLLAERPDRSTRRLSAGGFAADFERAYAEEMAWRASPEGFDPAAVSPLAALTGAMGGTYSPEQTRQIREAMTRRLYEAVASPLLGAYRESAGLPNDAWDRLAPRLVVVWDTMNVESLRALLPEWEGLPQSERLDNFLGEDDPAGDDDGNGHVRRSFAALNAEVPERSRLVKIGEAETSFGEGEPLRADVYRRPEVDAETTQAPPSEGEVH